MKTNVFYKNYSSLKQINEELEEDEDDEHTQKQLDDDGEIKESCSEDSQNNDDSRQVEESKTVSQSQSPSSSSKSSKQTLKSSDLKQGSQKTDTMKSGSTGRFGSDKKIQMTDKEVIKKVKKRISIMFNRGAQSPPDLL